MLKVFIFALLTTITGALYASALYSPFTFDDDHFVLNNPQVNGSEPIRISGPRSLTLLTYRLQGRFLPDLVWFHAFNLSIHVLNGFFVWKIAAVLLGSAPGLWAAAFFLLHPLQSQAVIYVSGRGELLAMTGILISCYFAIRERWFLAALVGILAMMAKETALVLPLLWFVIGPNKRKMWSIAGLGIIAVLLNPSMQSHATRIFDNLALGTQASAITSLLLLTVAPFFQTIDHEFTFSALRVGFLIGLGVTGLLYRNSAIGKGLLWTLILLVPHLVGGPRGYLAEHHLYAPFFGLALIFGSFWKGHYGRNHVPATYVQRPESSALRA